MFRDLGRVHIVSFAVGIVGLVIGIIGIVLAIVFGTSQATCTTPATPTCPPQVTSLPCNTNLFSIKTTVNNIPWDNAYSDPTSQLYNSTVANITTTLTDSLNTGLNSPTSSSFLRILAATGPTSNNAKVVITQLVKGTDGKVVAIGNGAISAAADLKNMPNSVNVQNVINGDNATYSDAQTSQQVCNPIIVPQDCPTTVAPVECSTASIQTTTPIPTNPATSSAAQVVTTTIPVITTTTTQKATSATGTIPQTTTKPVVPETTTKPVVPETTTKSQSSSVAQSYPSTITTKGVQSTTTLVSSTMGPSTSTKGIPITSTQFVPSTSSALPITTRTTQGSPSPGTTKTVPITSTMTSVAPSTSPTTPTTQIVVTSTLNPTTNSQTPPLSSSSTRTVPPSSTNSVTSTRTAPSNPPTSTITPTSSRTSSSPPVVTTQSQSSNLPTSTTPLTSSTPSGTSTILTTSTQRVSSSTPSPSSYPSTTQSVASSSGSPSPSLTYTTPTQSPSPSTSIQPLQSTSTIPVTSPTTPASSTAPPTIGPNQCYYQSDIALALELTDPTAQVDIQMQDFIINTLMFYPGNPYILGDQNSTVTRLAIAPYPVFADSKELMIYGEAVDQNRIRGLLSTFGIFAGPDAEINQSLDVIANLTNARPTKFVIIIGNNGTSITTSIASSKKLQDLGYGVMTIAYNSTANFSPLASRSDYAFQINQASDELDIAQKIGNILNNTFCTSTPVAPQSSSTAPRVLTSTTAGVQTASTATSLKISSTIPQSSSSVQVTSTVPSNPSTSATSSTKVPVQSTSPIQLTSSSSAPSAASTTIRPTIAPGQCYYQTNVAVAFELTSSTSDMDLQIQSFITNNLFFYGGAPYELGAPTDGKTELSLVPYPNDDTLAPLMAYGTASTQSAIQEAMDVFQLMAKEPSQISDAFNIIPNNTRIGCPGFVILVANSDVSVQNAVNSATHLKSLGFQIITVAFKSAGSFNALASQPSYNFQIHQDVDQASVAMAIGNILNTTWCTMGCPSVGSTASPGVPTSTLTVPQRPSSSPVPTSTVPVQTSTMTGSTSMFQSSSTVSYTTTSGPTPTTCVCTTVEAGTTTPGYSTSAYATTMGTSQYSTATTSGGTTGPTQPNTSSATQQSTSMGSSTPSPTQPSTPTGSTVTSLPSQSTTQGISTSSYSTASGSTNTATTPGGSSSPSQQSSTQSISTASIASSSPVSTTATTPGGSSSQQTNTPSFSSTVTIPSTMPTSSGTPGPTTSQICPNQQTVFNGQVGIVYEMLPNSNQQNTINDFVENILLNSNYYGLAVDNLSLQNRTLVTAIPYPSTSKYNVQGYGSARSQSDFKNQVIAFNGVIQPVTATSDISDALLYITTNLPANGVKSTLVIVGNSAKMIDATAPILTNELQKTFDIYTVSVGNDAVDLSALSSGSGFSFTGNSQQVADQIGLKMATSNPAIYCPPPTPSTAAPITSTVTFSPTIPVTTTVLPTTRMSTARPTVGPCQCTGRWVYNGDLAIAFEYVKNSNGSQKVTDFIRNTLLSNPDSYGLSTDVNGNQASKLTIVPYPDPDNYQMFPYGSIHYPKDIGSFIDAYSEIQTDNKDPSISSAFDYINSNLTADASTKVVLLVGSDGSDVGLAADSANTLKNGGYTVITVAQTVSADVFKPLASGNQYALHIGDGNDNDIATQIANLLLDLSFVCFDNGSSTPSPITRCPGTQGTTQPSVTGTPTSSASVASSSSVGSTASPGTSTIVTTQSTVNILTSQGSTSSGSSSTSINTESTTTMAIGSTSTQGSTISGALTSSQTVPSSTAANTGSTTMGSTVTFGSTTISSTVATPSSSSAAANTGSTTTQTSASSSTVPAGSTPTGSTLLPSSSASPANTGSTTVGSTVTQVSTVANTGSTTVGSTVTQGSSTATNTGSTTAPVQSSTAGSTMTQSLPSTSAPPLCATPYTGKIATLIELNTIQAEISDVVTFASSNLYNSANYDFTGPTQAINVPYGSTDNYLTYILQYGAAKSLGDLQANIDTMFQNSVLTTNPEVDDGLQFLIDYTEPLTTGTNGVIIVVGNHADSNFGLTSQDLFTLKQQGYKVISVAVGTNHGDLSMIADKPEWYFQVGDTNGQSVANQISYILCNL